MKRLSRKKVPFQFKNETKDDKTVIVLSGVIRKRYWDDDDCIDARLLRDALDGVEGDVVIKLNSGGGDAFEGLEMYNYLKDHPSHITVEGMGLVASAATFIMSGADRAVMNVGAVYMIHEAETYAWGNKAEIKKAVGALETIDRSILDIYTNKTGQSEEQITEWVNGEKWFTADEAVKFGFADEVKGKTESQNLDNAVLSNMVSNAVAQAMAQYQNQKPAAKEPEPKKQKSLLNMLRKGE